jgi:predicted permease
MFFRGKGGGNILYGQYLICGILFRPEKTLRVFIVLFCENISSFAPPVADPAEATSGVSKARQFLVVQQV